MNLSTDEFCYLRLNTSNDASMILEFISIGPIVLIIILIIGVLGNGTLVLIFVCHKIMWNAQNIYILNLALGDLLLVLVYVPCIFIFYIPLDESFNKFICRIIYAGIDVSVGISVFTLTVISADRYFAIVYPLKKLRSSIGGQQAPCFTLFVIFAIWTLAVLFAIPGLFVWNIKINENNGSPFEICYACPITGKVKTVMMAKFLVYYMIPLMMIGCFYVLIALNLFHSTRNIPGEMQPRARHIQSRRKVAKTVLVFVITFALIFFPQNAFRLWFYFYPEPREDYDVIWHLFRMCGNVFTSLNSCINPIIVYCVGTTFRKYFNYHLFEICRKAEKKVHKQVRLSFLKSRTLVDVGKNGIQLNNTVNTLQTNSICNQSDIVIDTVLECSGTTIREYHEEHSILTHIY